MNRLMIVLMVIGGFLICDSIKCANTSDTINDIGVAGIKDIPTNNIESYSIDYYICGSISSVKNESDNREKIRSDYESRIR